MSADLLRHIPGITVHEPAAGVLAVTAPDGFHLTIAKKNGVWRFRRGAISTATHFHLRQLIHEALNGIWRHSESHDRRLKKRVEK